MASLPIRDQGFLPLGEYGLLGDGSTAALVGRDGSIDWLCWPRFDSPSVFGRILGRGAGHFSVRALRAREITRAYRPGTNVLVTTFRRDGGEALVVDCMAARLRIDGEFESRNALIRSIECTGGNVDIEVTFAPVFDYGGAGPSFEETPSGIIARSGNAWIGLSSTKRLNIAGGSARLRASLSAGERIDLLASWKKRPRSISSSSIDGLVAETELGWRTWKAKLTYEGPFTEAVERSTLLLKLLDYAPTGASVAAPTTSLPERIGGVRNWDYRYGWIRDVAYGVYGLRRVGLWHDAGQFMDWAFSAARCSPRSVQAMYKLDGGRRLQERLLDHLEGYRGSRPVRTGNAAATQLQLDAFGELLDCFHQWRRDGGAVTPAMWQCLRSQVDWLADNWERPDHGIWEVRTTSQRFTHSAAMSHVALDRGIRAAEEVGLSAPLERWRAERERTLRAVVEEAWSDEIRSIARTLRGRDVDASLLALPLRRVVPATHPRMRSTIRAIQERLGAGGGLLYRYLSSDGLPPGEGAFLVSSFWMVDCLAMLGQRDQAGELYEQLLGYRNDLGLLSEQIDPGTKELLGNFPQALSHIGVLGSAVNLARGQVPREP